eukprot:scaffold62113_cov51-Phaeocystis_antarctica.AAC.1
MSDAPIRTHYAAHPWSEDTPRRLEAWRKGATGYPMVDAGMRCLYATGCGSTRPSSNRGP